MLITRGISLSTPLPLGGRGRVGVGAARAADNEQTGLGAAERIRKMD